MCTEVGTYRAAKPSRIASVLPACGYEACISVDQNITA
jgi:hypothetical protein